MTLWVLTKSLVPSVPNLPLIKTKSKKAFRENAEGKSTPTMLDVFIPTDFNLTAPFEKVTI